MSGYDAMSGIGTTITFATSAFTAKVKGYSDLGVERPVLDATHMGSAVSATAPFAGLIFQEKCPGDLGMVKELKLDVIFNPDDNTVPIAAAEEVITLQFLAKGGDATGPQWIFTGFVSDFNASIPHDGLVTGTMTLQVNGEPTWNAGSA